MVAAFHLEKIGVKLTKMSKEQADYIGVPLAGPTSRTTTATETRTASQACQDKPGAERLRAFSSPAPPRPGAFRPRPDRIAFRLA